MWINFGIFLVTLAITFLRAPNLPSHNLSAYSFNLTNNPSTSMKSVIGIKLSFPGPSVFSLNT